MNKLYNIDNMRSFNQYSLKGLIERNIETYVFKLQINRKIWSKGKTRLIKYYCVRCDFPQ